MTAKSQQIVLGNFLKLDVVPQTAQNRVLMAQIPPNVFFAFRNSKDFDPKTRFLAFGALHTPNLKKNPQGDLLTFRGHTGAKKKKL